MIVIRTKITTANHLDITCLLRKITNNTAGNKHNEFGRIISININPVKTQKIPQKGNCLVANAPQKKINRATAIGSSVDRANEYQRAKG